MVKRKVDPVVAESSRKAPARRAHKAAAVAAAVVEKVAGKGKKQSAKKAKRRSRQERAGLSISPNRCHRILSNVWRGGKVAQEADVVVAAMLQYFCEMVLMKGLLLLPDDKKTMTCTELQRAISALAWPEQSGLLKVHIVGAALGE
jgi:hypothetical protein